MDLDTSIQALSHLVTITRSALQTKKLYRPYLLVPAGCGGLKLFKLSTCKPSVTTTPLGGFSTEPNVICLVEESHLQKGTEMPSVAPKETVEWLSARQLSIKPRMQHLAYRANCQALAGISDRLYRNSSQQILRLWMSTVYPRFLAAWTHQSILQ